MPLTIQHQADSAGDKAVSLIADNGGTNVAAAFKGVNKATQNGDTVADLVVSLDSETVDLTIQKTEDAAHSSGDKGIMALAVRKDTATALAGTDGDYAPLEVDAVGALHTVDRAGYADGATFTRASSRLLAGLAGIYESTISALTAGKVALARLTSRGAVVTAPDTVISTFNSGTVTSATTVIDGITAKNLYSMKIGSTDGATYGTASTLFVPMGNGNFTKFWLTYHSGATAHDQIITLIVREHSGSTSDFTSDKGGILLSFNIGAGHSNLFLSVGAGVAGIGAQVGGATATSSGGDFYALTVSPGCAAISVSLQTNSGTPTTGAIGTIRIGRA